MRVLMLLSSTFPPDSRVEKEAKSLTEAGHEVHVLCYANKEEPHYEETENFIIHRFNACDLFINKASALALITPFFFHKWQKRTVALHEKYRFDLFHIHDLPLSKVGYFFKKRYGSILVCDQHEFYSDWIKKTAHMNTVPGRIVSALSNWERYEKKYLKRADLIITVADQLEINYLNKYPINKERIITIPNTPAKRLYNQENIDREIIEKYKSDFIIFYAGGMDILRGIDTAIIAMAEIKKRIPNARLLLCGKIVKPYDPFKTAQKYGVSDLVSFGGWINEEMLPSYISAADICFFTPPENRDEINKTIATKIYQYAVMGKPIIVSRAELMREFVETNQLGISVTSGNSAEFADAVLKIYNRELTIKKISPKNIFWEETVPPLIEKFNKFEQQKSLQ